MVGRAAAAYSGDMENNVSVVSRCDATPCRFNEDGECHAGQIEVSLSGDRAQCLTFSPRDDGPSEQPSARH